MRHVYTGPKRCAFLLHRNLKRAGYDPVILMTGTDEPHGTVFVSEKEYEPHAIAIAIEEAELDHDVERGESS